MNEDIRDFFALIGVTCVIAALITLLTAYLTARREAIEEAAEIRLCKKLNITKQELEDIQIMRELKDTP